MKLQALTIYIDRSVGAPPRVMADGTLVDDEGERVSQRWTVGIEDGALGIGEAGFDVLCLAVREAICPQWRKPRECGIPSPRQTEASDTEAEE